jgi:hypothetical protein
MLAEVVPELPGNIPAVNQAAQWFFTLFQMPMLVAAGVLALRLARRYQSPIPLLFLVGGGLAMLNEPIVDHNAAVWFPTEGQWTLYTTFGIPQPVWLATAYVWFFGGQALLLWHLLEQGLAASRLWKAFAVLVLSDIVLEHPGLYVDLFLYYGEQPFQFSRFPLWWGFVNATTPLVCATLVYLLRPQLTGRRAFALVLVVPMVSAGTNAALAWPVWNAVNSTWPWPVVWAAGGLTVGLSLFTVHLLIAGLERFRTLTDAPVPARAPGLRAGQPADV